jgi:uncharacterized membrane protein
MKDFLIGLLIDFMAFIITGSGLAMFIYFMKNEITFSSLVIGVVGFLFGVAPTLGFWEQKIKDSFKKED